MNAIIQSERKGGTESRPHETCSRAPGRRWIRAGCIRCIWRIWLRGPILASCRRMRRKREATERSARCGCGRRECQYGQARRKRDACAFAREREEKRKRKKEEKRNPKRLSKLPQSGSGMRRRKDINSINPPFFLVFSRLCDT